MLQIGEGGGVLMLANYSVDAKPLPAGTTIVCGSPSCDLVRIDFPIALTYGGGHFIRIANVVDRNGQAVVPDPTITPFDVERA